MSVIANVPILYQGVQYKPGDVIKDYSVDILELWLKHGSVRKSEPASVANFELEEEGKTPIADFNAQQGKDLNDVFLNAANKEFATIHKIGGVRGDKITSEKEVSVVVDYELYRERNIKDGIENITLAGLVFFIKKDEYLESFKNLPQVGSGMGFDKKKYIIDSLNDDMGMLEFTLSSAEG